MYKFNKLFFLAAILLLGTISCNDDAVFQKEMYKHVISLISGEQYNVYQEVVKLTGGKTTGSIALSVGGSKPTTKDVVVSLEESEDPLEFYNISLFDRDEEEYAHALDKSQYELESYDVTIPKGERVGTTKVSINPEGLSPDSVYFIPLKIVGLSDTTSFEINEEHSTILFQVLIENEYASQAKTSMYKMSGILDEAPTAGNVRMLPLSHNKVRINAGGIAYQPSLEVIDNSSIVLEVLEDNSISITPYKNIGVIQLDNNPDYPNKFVREEDRFGRVYNDFLLSYEYTT